MKVTFECAIGAQNPLALELLRLALQAEASEVTGEAAPAKTTKRTAPLSGKAADAPSQEQATVNTPAPEQPAPEQPAKKISLESLKEKTLKRTKESAAIKTKVLELIASYGVKAVSELPEAVWAEYLTKLEAITNA